MDPHLRHVTTMQLVEECLSRQAEIPLKASGLSMGRTIRSGEWIVARRVEPCSVTPGDIVLFRLKDTFVAHRVLRRRRDGEGFRFTTKGDGHLCADAPIAGLDIVAKVMGVRRAGNLCRFDTPMGRLGTALLLASSWAVWSCVVVLRPAASAARLLPYSFRTRLVRLARAVLLFPHRVLSEVTLARKRTRRD